MNGRNEGTRGSILPEHESFRRAIRWISSRREEQPELRPHELVAEAARRFDLSPKDEIALLHLISGGPVED